MAACKTCSEVCLRAQSPFSFFGSLFILSSRICDIIFLSFLFLLNYQTRRRLCLRSEQIFFPRYFYFHPLCPNLMTVQPLGHYTTKKVTSFCRNPQQGWFHPT